MWAYLLLVLRRQPGKSAMMSGGFLVAACALILLTATTQTTTVQANQIISQSWRPTYDLVVLPANMHIPPGQDVPPDFLEGYSGGISMEEYAQIKQIAGVQVAAPIAYIGYVSLPPQRITFPDRDFAPGFYRLDWNLTAFNGEKHLTEFQERDIYYIFPCGVGYNRYDLSYVIQHPEVQTQAYQDGECPPGAIQGLHPTMRFVSPDLGSFLLAAVDPEAENQLVHLDQSITAGRALTNQDAIHDEDPAKVGGFHFCDQEVQTNPPSCKEIPPVAVPMVIHQNLSGQVSLTTQFSQLALGNLPADQLQQLSNTTFEQQLPGYQNIFNGSVPLVQDDPQNFANTDLAWDGQTWKPQPPPDPYTLKVTLINFYDATTPAGLNYQQATGPDGSPAYQLVANGAEGPEVTFRPLTPLKLLKKSYVDVVYTYDQVGQFSDQSIASQFDNPLNWLPENTYTAPPVMLRYDAQGYPITPTMLLPTTNKAGFLLQPPLALTTLAAAQQLVGNTPINAIRVRVAGVDRANDDSWKKIQQVAGLIHQQTGLTVVITLGSSPRPTLIYVPGAKQGAFGENQAIDPIGWVEERWISIGVSVVYLAHLGAFRLILIGSMLAVCLGYLLVSFSTLAASQRRDCAILSALGWPPWQHARLFLMQTLLFALGGGVAGVGLALIIISALSAIPIWLIVLWTLPAMLVLALLSSLYPLWQFWRISPAEILRGGPAPSASKARRLGGWLRGRLSPIGMLALQNLARSRARTFISALSLFLSAVLLMLILSSILALRQTLLGTLLGNFVLLQTAVPQIAGCVFALLLTFLSVADLLLLQVRERQSEIGLLLAVGWRPQAVQRQFVQEAVVLGMLGVLPGVGAALGLLGAFHIAPAGLPGALIAPLTALLLVLMAGLATIPALRAINRLSVADVLRGE
ncbi:MAG TPA: FtsX-like permease family protein [Ktedonobacterales bacterium]